MAEKLLSANEKTPGGVASAPSFKFAELEFYDKIPAEYMANAEKLLINLQKIRDKVGKPLVIMSGYRSWERQQIVNPSVKKSQHMTASASDLKPPAGMNATELHKIILDLIDKKVIYNGGVGLYVKENFVHYDVRPEGPARWQGN